MRRTAHILRTAAASTAVAAALTLAGTAPAMAATTDTGTGTGGDTTASTVGTVTTPGSSVPGYVSVSGTARPGSTVSFSGSCRIVSGTEGYPTVDTVTSSAFSTVAMDRTNPEAFDGTATIAANAAPGAHGVVAHCSNGDVSATVDVSGGHVVPNGGGGTGRHGSSSSGSSAGSSSGGTVVDDPINAFVDGLTDDATLPWVLGGLAITTVAGIGAYALGRGRAADAQREADRRAREAWEDRQAWEARRREGWDPMSRR